MNERTHQVVLPVGVGEGGEGEAAGGLDLPPRGVAPLEHVHGDGVVVRGEEVGAAVDLAHEGVRAVEAEVVAVVELGQGLELPGARLLAVGDHVADGGRPEDRRAVRAL